MTEVEPKRVHFMHLFKTPENSPNENAPDIGDQGRGYRKGVNSSLGVLLTANDHTNMNLQCPKRKFP
jgi:hypothetical protein